MIRKNNSKSSSKKNKSTAKKTVKSKSSGHVNPATLEQLDMALGESVNVQMEVLESQLSTMSESEIKYFEQEMNQAIDFVVQDQDTRYSESIFTTKDPREEIAPDGLPVPYDPQGFEKFIITVGRYAQIDRGRRGNRRGKGGFFSDLQDINSAVTGFGDVLSTRRETVTDPYGEKDRQQALDYPNLTKAQRKEYKTQGLAMLGVLTGLGLLLGGSAINAYTGGVTTTVDPKTGARVITQNNPEFPLISKVGAGVIGTGTVYGFGGQISADLDRKKSIDEGEKEKYIQKNQVTDNLSAVNKIFRPKILGILTVFQEARDNLTATQNKKVQAQDNKAKFMAQNPNFNATT